MVLNTQPAADVTIALIDQRHDRRDGEPGELTFTTANWNIAQTVTVTGVNDAIPDGDQAVYDRHRARQRSDPAYNGLDPADVVVTNTDNDAAGITVSPVSGLLTTEGGRHGHLHGGAEHAAHRERDDRAVEQRHDRGHGEPGEPDLHDRELEQRRRP